jgi:hypothetical protein
MKKNLIVVANLLALSGCQVAATRVSDPSTMTCEQHLQMAQKANDFAARNFDKAYSHDVQGADAQLFLIKAKGPGSYSANYNAAEKDYQKNLEAANAAGCDTSSYPVAPIAEFEHRLGELKAAAK